MVRIQWLKFPSLELTNETVRLKLSGNIQPNGFCREFCGCLCTLVFRSQIISSLTSRLEDICWNSKARIFMLEQPIRIIMSSQNGILRLNFFWRKFQAKTPSEFRVSLRKVLAGIQARILKLEHPGLELLSMRSSATCLEITGWNI